MPNIKEQDKGTFTAVGTSNWVSGTQVDIALRFVGTGSVQIERKMASGEGAIVGSVIIETDTENHVQVVTFGTVQAVRLNCTAAGADIEYDVDGSGTIS